MSVAADFFCCEIDEISFRVWWIICDELLWWNEMTEWSLLWITQNWSQGEKKKLRTFISSLSLHILVCTRFWSTPLIKRFRGFKISQWPLRFCQLLDNMSLVTQNYYLLALLNFFKVTSFCWVWQLLQNILKPLEAPYISE